MMKYLRTENAMYAYASTMPVTLKSDKQARYYRQVPSSGKLYRYGAGSLQKKFILKQSQYIHSIAEEFLYKETGRRPKIMSSLEKAIEQMKLRGGCIYAAIWVKGGLQFVAKQTEKMRWELL